MECAPRPPVVKTRRGRPCTVGSPQMPSSQASIRLPVSIHDRLIRMAQQERTSVADVIRRLVLLQLP